MSKFHLELLQQIDKCKTGHRLSAIVLLSRSNRNTKKSNRSKLVSNLNNTTAYCIVFI